MITEKLQSPVMQAVLELIAADSAEEQAEVLARRGALFLTLGADGALAALCQICASHPNFVLRLESMRIALNDVRTQLDDPAQVEPALRRFLPLGGPNLPGRAALDYHQPEAGAQLGATLWAYVWAEAWRVRHGIVEAFPAVFTESDLALELLAQLRTLDVVEQIPGFASAANYLVRIRADGGGEQQRGLTGFARPPSIRTAVLPLIAEDEYTELFIYEYQECRSVETRAELLEELPLLTSDRALQYCEMFIAHHQRLGRPDAVKAFESVARSLVAARTGHFDEAAALVQDIGYMPVEVQAAELVEAMTTGDLRRAANLLRYSLHQFDRQLGPHHWAAANKQLADVLEKEASRAAGTSSFVIEEIVLRCLRALSVLDGGTKQWTDVCVTLANALVNRIRGNSTASLDTATSLLAEVGATGLADEDAAGVHLGLATAYCELFGESATENLRRALGHAEQALEIYEVAGDRLRASEARFVLARAMVKAAGQVRGPYRMSLLDNAEEYLGQCDFTAPNAPLLSENENAVINQVVHSLGLADEAADLIRAGGAPTSLPPHVPVLQLQSMCKMLRYSDGTPDFGAHLAAVELHQQALAEINRDTHPNSWAQMMLSLANMYTRYPEPTDEMLDRAEEAQHAALHVFRAEHADYGTGLATVALGNLAFRRHHWAEAAKWLGEAASIFAEGEAWSTSDRGVLAQVSALRDSYARLSYALHRAGRPARECLEWLERGKTHLATGRDNVPFEFDEVTDAVPPHGAIVIPLITSQGSLLWTIVRAPDGTLALITTELDNLTDRDLDALYGTHTTPGWAPAYNAFLEFESEEVLDTWAATIDQVCNALWRLVGVHVDASLRTAGVAEGDPVVIAPPRQLSILPLHAAYRNEDGKRHYLGDGYAITYIPSLRTLAVASARSQARTAGPLSLLAIADPLGDLPHAVAEAEAITKYFMDGYRKTLSGEAATIDQIVEYAAGRTHLHIACHGSFDSDNPLRSSLYLADGPMQVNEMNSLFPLDEFDLVTLSACETGLLDNTRAPYEWLGIAGALTRAGATDIICTLWSIDDEATAQLIDHFYRLLIEDRMPPAQALQMAQAEVKSEPDFRHPFYWAAFMHVGVPREVN